MMSAVFESRLEGLALLGRGKVRDWYAVDEGHLLFVATDRLSAFDVVLPDPVPGKGVLLTALSEFWFARAGDIVANQLSGRRVEDLGLDAADYAQVRGRGMIVKKLRPLPVEAVVRGYLGGSGWRDYAATGAVSGIALPPGLRRGERLPRPIFTPSTKAAAGAHDESIDFERVVELLGGELARRMREISLELYAFGAAHALRRGIIIADTKFEFGLDEAGDLYLIDEVMTPDSSRFWPCDEYRVGGDTPSLDKQYARDYLETLDWDKRAPGPRLPKAVVAGVLERYRRVYERLVSGG